MIGDPYGKGRAPGLFTLREQFAALHLDHIFTDGQSETGTAVLAGNGRIRLFKGFEDSTQAFFAYPDARILDGDLDDNGAFVLVTDLGDNVDMPFLGEFKGIAEHIVQHLAQAIWIAFDDHIGRNGILEYEPQFL